MRVPSPVTFTWENQAPQSEDINISYVTDIDEFYLIQLERRFESTEVIHTHIISVGREAIPDFCEKLMEFYRRTSEWKDKHVDDYE